MRELVLVVWVMVGCAACVQAAPVLWDVTAGGNAHHYELVTGAFLWEDAKAAAESASWMG